MKLPLKSQDGITLKTEDKYCSENIDVVPTLQSKEVSFSTADQSVTPDTGYAGLKSVKVAAIPDFDKYARLDVEQTFTAPQTFSAAAVTTAPAASTGVVRKQELDDTATQLRGMLDDKVNKISKSGTHVYAIEEGSNTSFPLDSAATANVVVRRAGTQINLPNQIQSAPTTDQAISSRFADNKYLAKAGGTISGNLAITGNLTVSGTTTAEKQEQLLVKANVIATNADKADLKTLLSGLAINKNATATYGIMYDPVDDTVKFGEGTLSADNKFVFKEGEGHPLAIRADSTAFTDAHLVKWDAANNSFVDAGVAVADINTNIDKKLDKTGGAISGGLTVANAPTSDNGVVRKKELDATNKTIELVQNDVASLGSQVSTINGTISHMQDDIDGIGTIAINVQDQLSTKANRVSPPASGTVLYGVSSTSTDGQPQAITGGNGIAIDAKADGTGVEVKVDPDKYVERYTGQNFVVYATQGSGQITPRYTNSADPHTMVWRDVNGASKYSNVFIYNRDASYIEGDAARLIDVGAICEITGQPASATAGTLTETQLKVLSGTSLSETGNSASPRPNAYILFNNERYYPMSYGHEAGYQTYSNVDSDTIKRIKVNMTTGAWTLTTNNVGGATNIQNGTGTGAVKQTTDPKYSSLAIATKNPNAAALDSTLTDSEPLGAVGDYSSAFGGNTSAQGKRSCASGTSTLAKGAYSHAEGCNSVSLGDTSHAEGYQTTAKSNMSHTEGGYTIASGHYAHAEGFSTTASGEASHAEGGKTAASRYYAHAEGDHTEAKGDGSHAEGGYTKATGNLSHVEGYLSKATGDTSHAEGNSTTASGTYSHAEGAYTSATGDVSHAEGSFTKTFGAYAHSEGASTVAQGEASHAQGNGAVANGKASDAGGYRCSANGDYSFARGNGSTAQNEGQSALGVGIDSGSSAIGGMFVGKYNAPNDNAIFQVGNGTDATHRSNAFSIDSSGNATVAGRLSVASAPVNDNDVVRKADLASAGGGGSWHTEKPADTRKVQFTRAKILTTGDIPDYAAGHECMMAGYSTDITGVWGVSFQGSSISALIGSVYVAESGIFGFTGTTVPTVEGTFLDTPNGGTCSVQYYY